MDTIESVNVPAVTSSLPNDLWSLFEQPSSFPEMVKFVPEIPVNVKVNVRI